jgi:uncharacterized protein (TIGR00297 family)
VDPLAWRAAAGLTSAAAVAWAARGLRALSTGGAAAAIGVGTACVLAGWTWGLLLMTFFVSGTLLSRVGRARKSARTAGVIDKGGTRDAWQVFANGGVFALAALMSLGGHPGWWQVAGAGALATSTADTWATELGLLAGATPRSIVTGRPLTHGLSGGVTIAGSLAMIGGAMVLAGVARAAAWPPGAVRGAIGGGIAGALADSVLGATLQIRRRCPRCGVATEAPRHGCGVETEVTGGLHGLNNDRVNLVSGVIGAAVAVLIA